MAFKGFPIVPKSSIFERDHSGVARSKFSPLIQQINKKGGGRRVGQEGKIDSVKGYHLKIKEVLL